MASHYIQQWPDFQGRMEPWGLCKMKSSLINLKKLNLYWPVQIAEISLQTCVVSQLSVHQISESSHQPRSSSHMIVMWLAGQTWTNEQIRTEPFLYGLPQDHLSSVALDSLVAWRPLPASVCMNLTQVNPHRFRESNLLERDEHSSIPQPLASVGVVWRKRLCKGFPSVFCRQRLGHQK